jgi:type II secretory pathway component GspD/PulD (secretin)
MTLAARLFTLVLFVVSPPQLAAQTPPAAAHPPADEVKIYSAKHASPADLVKALGRLYDNARVRCVASPSGTAVVLSGRPTEVDQAIQALGALDARPAVVEVEVLIVAAGEAPLDPKLFRGTAAEVAAALEGLKKDGVTVRRIVLDGVEGQPVTKQTGEDRAFIVATTVTAAGGFGRAGSQTYNRRNLGTTVEVTPRVRPDGRIGLDLKIEDSRAVPQEGADAQTTFSVESFKGTVAVAPNQAQVVSSSDDARTKGQRTAFVVVARVVDAP